MILLLRERGGPVTALAKANLGDGKMAWQILFEDRLETDSSFNETLEKQRRYDPDLWLIELDVENPTRFIADPVLPR